jgi:hypothetical protein
LYLRWRGVRVVRSILCSVVCSAALLTLSACGVKTTSSTTPVEQPPSPPNSGTTTPILLTLTDDATSNGLVSFFANISLVQITPRNGGDSTLYTSTSNIELTHLAGTAHYLTLTSLPTDSYRKMTVTVTDPLITYIDSTGATVTEEFPTFTAPAEIDFSDLLNLDTFPVEITLDFNLEKSVVLDPLTGVMTLTPTFTASALPITSGTPTIGTGLLETMLGSVGVYANGAMVLTAPALAPNDAQLNVSCNLTGATTTANYSASTGLPRGALVRVNMVAQPDASINCGRIEAINSSNVAYAMAGTVNSFRGQFSPFQMTLAMQEGTGAGISPQFIGSGINVNFDSSTTFAIDWDGMDQTNLGFTPVFSQTKFFPAQYVEASSSIPLLTTGNDIGAIPGSMITVAAMNAEKLTLRKQSEEGTVSSVATDSNGVTRFTLTVAPSSVFAAYTALLIEPVGFLPTINVIVPAGAPIDGSLTSPITGAPVGSLPYVKVYGLLFLNGTTYTFVAQRITATLPPVVPPITTIN